MAPRYSQKRFSIWRPSAILKLQNFELLLNVRHGNWNMHQPTKFYQNRIILGWYMDLMLFSKWRLSAILSLRKIAVLVTWHISACDPSSLFLISRWSANMTCIQVVPADESSPLYGCRIEWYNFRWPWVTLSRVSRSRDT